MEVARRTGEAQQCLGRGHRPALDRAAGHGDGVRLGRASTGRAVVAHEAQVDFGVGAEIAARLQRELFGRAQGAGRPRRRGALAGALLEDARSGLRSDPGAHRARRYRKPSTRDEPHSSMSMQILLPKLGFSVNEATSSNGCVPTARTVAKGEPLYALESEKSVQEIDAPTDGVLKILKPAGEVYEVGTVIARDRVMTDRRLAPPPGRPILPPMPVIDFGQFGAVETVALSRTAEAASARSWRATGRRSRTSPTTTRPTIDAARGPARSRWRARLGIKLTPAAVPDQGGGGGPARLPAFQCVARARRRRWCSSATSTSASRSTRPNGPGRAGDPRLRQQVDRANWPRELADKAERARTKGLPMAEMSGGCFSISSLGAIGGTAFTPIINAPEVAILGVTRAAPRLAAGRRTACSRKCCRLSLSYDHRVINGADAARFCALRRRRPGRSVDVWPNARGEHDSNKYKRLERRQHRFSLAGRVALVTGASSGLRRTLRRRCWRAPAPRSRAYGAPYRSRAGAGRGDRGERRHVLRLRDRRDRPYLDRARLRRRRDTPWARWTSSSTTPELSGPAPFPEMTRRALGTRCWTSTCRVRFASRAPWRGGSSHAGSPVPSSTSPRSSGHLAKAMFTQLRHHQGRAACT